MGLRRWYARAKFDTKSRLEVYEKLRAAAEEGISLKAAVDNLADIYARRSKTHPFRTIFEEWATELSAGKPFHEAVGHWIPKHERLVLSCSDRGQSLVEAFKNIERQVSASAEMKSTIVVGAMAPMLYLLIVTGILYIVSTRLLPELLLTVDRDKALQSAWLFVRSSEMIGAAPWAPTVFIFVAVAVLLFAMPLNFPLRTWLDNFPPFTLYRLIQGSSFLLTLVGLTRVGVQQVEAIRMISEDSPPWLKKRCEAITDAMYEGKQFGAACDAAGHDFPSRKIIDDVLFYEQTSKASIAVERAATRWIDEGKARVKAATMGLVILSMFLMASVLVWIVAGIGSVLMGSDLFSGV
jgi:type II secretory pathway component PulF